MPKNITWIVNNITQVGGIERVVCNISNYFQDNNYRVKIVSLNTTDGKAYFKLSSKVKIQHLGYPESENLNRKKLKATLKEFLINENGESDVLITCHPWIAMPILQQKSLYKGKIISTEHSAWEYHSKKRRLLNLVFYRRADRLVVLSDYARSIYQKYGLKNIAVIPNIITDYPEKLAPLQKKELIAAGRLTEVKGFDRLIKAIGLIKDSFTPWHLTIYGDGEDGSMLRGLIKENKLEEQITIAAFTDQIQEKIHNCSGFIISSHSEAFPMVALEALSNGVPVISFNIPSLKEIDQGKGNIIFAEQDDIDDLADKINTYIHSADFSARGIEARAISLSYSLENVGPQWLNLLEML